jgi:hypothetical protein
MTTIQVESGSQCVRFILSILLILSEVVRPTT